MSVLTVIAVHGIWETPLPRDPTAKLAYTGEFARNVVAALRRLGVIPPDASPDEVAAIVTFDTAQYADIGADAEQLTYDRYRQAAERVATPTDRALDWLAIDRLRRFMIAGASDVLFYQAEQYRELIRDRVREQIAAAIDTGSRAVTLVGHSLGSVVCYDIAYYDSYYNADWQRHGFTLANLFTLGSPLALFAMAFDERGQPKPKYTDRRAVKKLVRDGGHWYNCFDPQDIIGYPLEATFGPLVSDLVVQTGTLPTTAHARMWHSEGVAQQLAICLRDDYTRALRQS